jgi:hypothetical protein
MSSVTRVVEHDRIADLLLTRVMSTVPANRAAGIVPCGTHVTRTAARASPATGCKDHSAAVSSSSSQAWSTRCPFLICLTVVLGYALYQLSAVTWYLRM